MSFTISAHAADPLPSWNNGPNKQAILKFVSAVTKKSSPDYKSRIYAIGPQVGYFIPVGKEKLYLNLKGYYEFSAENRPEGWNSWVTLAVPLK